MSFEKYFLKYYGKIQYFGLYNTIFPVPDSYIIWCPSVWKGAPHCYKRWLNDDIPFLGSKKFQEAMIWVFLVLVPLEEAELWCFPGKLTGFLREQTASLVMVSNKFKLFVVMTIEPKNGNCKPSQQVNSNWIDAWVENKSVLLLTALVTHQSRSDDWCKQHDMICQFWFLNFSSAMNYYQKAEKTCRNICIAANHLMSWSEIAGKYLVGIFFSRYP